MQYVGLFEACCNSFLPEVSDMHDQRTLQETPFEFHPLVTVFIHWRKIFDAHTRALKILSLEFIVWKALMRALPQLIRVPLYILCPTRGLCPSPSLQNPGFSLSLLHWKISLAILNYSHIMCYMMALARKTFYHLTRFSSIAKNTFSVHTHP